MKLPDGADVEIALMWLESNEGDEEESGACLRVAEWLKAYAQDSFERSAARRAGVPVKRLREKLSRTRGQVGAP